MKSSFLLYMLLYMLAMPIIFTAIYYMMNAFYKDAFDAWNYGQAAVVVLLSGLVILKAYEVFRK